MTPPPPHPSNQNPTHSQKFRNSTSNKTAMPPNRTSLLPPTMPQDEDTEDVAVPSRAADMNKSLFSIIKAAGRSGNFQTRFDDVSSDDEADPPTIPESNIPIAAPSNPKLPSDSQPAMESSQILTPTRVTTMSTQTSSIEPRAPYLSMILKGEASMEASQHPSEEDESDVLAELEEPSAVSLAQRLKDIFDLEELEEVTAEFPCWLLHSVLVTGHLYLTTKHVCFYAYCPKLNSTSKSGWLRKRGRRNPRYRQYYMELKGDVLRYYNDRTDIYEPSGHIDLRFAVSATIEPESKKIGRDQSSYFKVVVNTQEYWFKAENHESALDWIKHLQRVIFRSHNSGDSVKICIPITNIIDIEDENVLDVSETASVKLRVIDNHETYGLDEYYFSFFEEADEAIRIFQQIAEENMEEIPESTNDLKENQRTSSPKRSMESVRNTLQAFDYEEPTSRKASVTSRPSSDNEKQRKSRSWSRQRKADRPKNRSAKTADSDLSASQFLNTTDVFQSATGRRITSDSDSDDHSPQRGRDIVPMPRKSSDDSRMSMARSAFSGLATPSASLQGLVKTGASGLRGVSNAAKFLTDKSRQLTTESFEKVTGMWNAQHKHYNEAKEARPYDDDLIEAGDIEGATKRFQQHFALPETEPLVATYYCWFIRLLGNYGKMYVGKRYVCFRSFATRTKLIFPIDKLESITKVPHSFLKDATRTYELVITAKGHESLFFAFTSGDSRDDAHGVILKSMDALHLTHAEDGTQMQQTIAEYESLKVAGKGPEISTKLVKRISSSANETIPPILFDDPNVSFLNFKPPKAMRITLLTIGSRGDVQPFIALGKGLMAEGHTVKLATHAEFEPWIRKHGLDFAPVSGDPGELMRICIEYGMFTLQFLMEARSKFGGWIDDLLITAWKACQGSELLIESPSAMAGIHIAEALKIPYFRAFTMPWTRTRAYPHAFYVPDQKRSGNFNSLSYVLIDQVFWKGTAGNINKWRRKTLGLPSTSLDHMQPNKVPFLYNFSPSVVPPPLDYPDWIRVTGYWFLDEGDKFTPPADIVAFMKKAKKDGKKLVYIGFGSILVENPAALTRTIIEAVKKADVRCILAKGWSDRQTKTIVPAGQQATGGVPVVEEIELGEQIFSVKSIPHDWLFPQMDAIVHHGGSGTTGASLRAGIPTIVKPFFGDQFFFAMRVEDLGVGIALKKLNSTNFWRALRDATTDQRMVDAARRLGEKMRTEDGVSNAINAIYRDLDYARTLIKDGTKGAKEGVLENIEEHWTFIEPDYESGNETETSSPTPTL